MSVKIPVWSYFYTLMCDFQLSRYLDDLPNIDNKYFDGLISQIYPSEPQLNKANSSETKAPFLDLHLSILDEFISCKIYDKRDDFEIVNCPYLHRDIQFARVSSHVSDFNTGIKLLTVKLLNQGYRYRKAFSKFYRHHFYLVSKFNVGLKSILQQGLSETDFYGNLVYKFRNIYACNDFSTEFRKTILRYIKIGYNINVIRQTEYMVVNRTTVNNLVSLFGCTPAG